MLDSNRVLASVTALVAAFFTTQAFAQPPSAGPGRGGDKPPNAAERAAAKEARAEERAARAEGKTDKAAPDGGASDRTGEHGRGPMMGHHHGPGGWRALGEDFREGRLKKGELKDRLAAMRDTMKERRREHQKMLEQRWGATLANPACREELRHHARREAFLGRALLVAETEVTKDKEKIIERIKKLMEKEDERHARAMERLKAMPGGAAPSAMPSAAPAMPSAVPAPSASAAKAGEQ